MAYSRLSKEIISDIQCTIAELWERELIRDGKGVAEHILPGNLCEITFPEKTDASGLMYDKKISCSRLADELLSERQYTILLYDKSIIQAEFVIESNSIKKERFVFIKKHNKIWDPDEINEYDANDEDWFSEEFGIPILLRVDYDPSEHRDCEHAASHLTLANHESCRIPMKQAITFSEFMRFILFHFYNVKLQKAEYRLNSPEDITESEKKMIHISWN